METANSAQHQSIQNNAQPILILHLITGQRSLTSPWADVTDTATQRYTPPVAMSGGVNQTIRPMWTTCGR